MEGLIHAFGIDWRLVLTQIVNFAVLAALLGYFLYTPVLRMLEKREQMIAKGVQEAREANELKASAETERDARIAEAEADAREVSLRAKRYADEQGVVAMRAATEKAEAALAAGEAKRDAIISKAHKEAEAEIAKIAVLAAEKVLLEKNA